MTVRVNLEDHARLFDLADRWQITPDRFLHISRGETLVASFNVWTSVELLEDEKPETNKIKFGTTYSNINVNSTSFDFVDLADKIESLGKLGKKFLA